MEYTKKTWNNADIPLADDFNRYESFLYNLCDNQNDKNNDFYILKDNHNKLLSRIDVLNVYFNGTDNDENIGFIREMEVLEKKAAALKDTSFLNSEDFINRAGVLFKDSVFTYLYLTNNQTLIYERLNNNKEFFDYSFYRKTTTNLVPITYSFSKSGEHFITNLTLDNSSNMTPNQIKCFSYLKVDEKLSTNYSFFIRDNKLYMTTSLSRGRLVIPYEKNLNRTYIEL